MSAQRGFVSADQFHPDPYTQSRTAERTLNSAIVHAEITRSYEEYIEIFDEFYAEEIEGSSETMSEPIRGKARVRSLLFNFLVPLHVMAEVGHIVPDVQPVADFRPVADIGSKRSIRGIIQRRGEIAFDGAEPDDHVRARLDCPGRAAGVLVGQCVHRDADAAHFASDLWSSGTVLASLTLIWVGGDFVSVFTSIHNDL